MHMTIKVIIKNDDTRDTAVISVTTMNIGAGEPDHRAGPPYSLAAGASADLWVHSHQYLIVREVAQ
jgi:hypothetical protein